MCLLRRQRLSLGTFKRSLCCGMAALLSTSALAAEGASRNIRIDPFDRLILFSSDTVIIESGATSASVDVTGPAEVIAAVSIRQVGRVLEVSRLAQPSRDTNAVIVIKTPSVSQIELNSSGSIELAPGHLDRLAAMSMLSWNAAPLAGRRAALTLCRPYVPLGSDGRSRMLETYSAQAHAPLPANRLDIRACHPASEYGDRVC